MKTLMTALSLASLAALAPVATLAAGNAVVVNPTGNMRIQLSVPLAEDVDLTRALTQGRLELAPAEGVPVVGGRYFMLTMANLRFADFRIDRWVIDAQNFSQVSVSLREAVEFTAATVSPGVYNFSIPRTRVTVTGTAIVNGRRRSGVDRPSEAVTGTIDLNAGTIRARAVFPKHYGCDWAWPCSVDGTVTVTFNGVLGPDSDGDGVRDSVDNCPLVPNPSQRRVVSPIFSSMDNVTFASCQERLTRRPTAVDICEPNMDTVVEGNPPPTWPLGATLVDWTARSAAGRVSSAQQQVTVVDQTAPSFKFVPGPIGHYTCGPVDLGLPMAYDDCDWGPPALFNNAPKVFGPGDTQVTWTARDRSGNSSVVTQRVTVKDAVPPVFTYVPPDVTIPRCDRVEDIGWAKAADDCGVTITNDAPKVIPQTAVVRVTWTARDGAGNVATATQHVKCEGKGGTEDGGGKGSRR